MDSRTPGLVATGEYCVCSGLVKRLDRRPVKRAILRELRHAWEGAALLPLPWPGQGAPGALSQALAARVYPTLCLAAGQAPPQTAGDVRLLVAEVDQTPLRLAMRTLASAQDRRAAEAEQTGGPKRLRVYEAAILVGIVTPYVALSTLARLIGRHWAALILEKEQPVTTADIVATRLGREGCEQ